MPGDAKEKVFHALTRTPTTSDVVKATEEAAKGAVVNKLEPAYNAVAYAAHTVSSDFKMETRAQGDKLHVPHVTDKSIKDAHAARPYDERDK